MSPSKIPTGVVERPFVLRHDFENAQDFLATLHPLSGLWTTNVRNWIFRGHADASWPLLPSAHREEPWRAFTEKNGKTFVPVGSTEDHRANRERALIQEFFDLADSAGLPLPLASDAVDHDIKSQSLWPTDRIVPLMALAQHYKVPTRLLDWSKLGRVAAYFAAIEPGPSATDLAVWALDSAYVREFAGTQYERVFIGTAARASNPNMHAQSGLFTFVRCHLDRLLPLDEILSDHTKVRKPRGECVLRKLVLPRRCASDLMALLHIEGVSALSLFPGYSGVAELMRERYLHGTDKVT